VQDTRRESECQFLITVPPPAVATVSYLEYISASILYRNSLFILLSLHKFTRFTLEFILSAFASALVAYGPRLIVQFTATSGKAVSVFIVGLVIGSAVVTALWGAVVYVLYVVGYRPRRIRRRLSELLGTIKHEVDWITDDLSAAEEGYEEALDAFEQSLSEIREVILDFEINTDADVAPLRTQVSRVTTRLEALDKVVKNIYNIDSDSSEEYRSWSDKYQVAIDDFSTALSDLGFTFDELRASSDTTTLAYDDYYPKWEEAYNSCDRSWRRSLRPRINVLVREVINYRDITQPRTSTPLPPGGCVESPYCSGIHCFTARLML
jgi:hypothetical protein